MPKEIQKLISDRERKKMIEEIQKGCRDLLPDLRALCRETRHAIVLAKKVRALRTKREEQEIQKGCGELLSDVCVLRRGLRREIALTKRVKALSMKRRNTE